MSKRRLRWLVALFAVLLFAAACSDDSDSSSSDDSDSGSGSASEPADSGDGDDSDDGDSGGDSGGSAVVIAGTTYSYEPNCFGQDTDEIQELEAIGTADDGTVVNVFVYFADGAPDGSISVASADGADTWGTPLVGGIKTLEIDGGTATGTATVENVTGDSAEATFEINCASVN